MKLLNFFVATGLSVIVPASVSKLAFARHPPHHLNPQTCLMLRHGDTAQCFTCIVDYLNGSLSAITDLNYNEGYRVEVGKGGWEVDSSEDNCLVNLKTGQKFCHSRC